MKSTLSLLESVDFPEIHRTHRETSSSPALCAVWIRLGELRDFAIRFSMPGPSIAAISPCGWSPAKRIALNFGRASGASLACYSLDRIARQGGRS